MADSTYDRREVELAMQLGKLSGDEPVYAIGRFFDISYEEADKLYDEFFEASLG